MLTLALIIVGLAGFMTLAMRRAPLWQWAVGAALVALLGQFGWNGGLSISTNLVGWLLAFVPAIIFGLLAITGVRRAVVATPAYGLVVKHLTQYLITHSYDLQRFRRKALHQTEKLIHNYTSPWDKIRRHGQKRPTKIIEKKKQSTESHIYYSTNNNI